MPHKTVAYLRVSTIDQDLEKNKATLLALANDKDLGKVEFIEETVSGKVSWRNRKISLLLGVLPARMCNFKKLLSGRGYPAH